jgi:UDP-N-acetylmuramate: L-alanyl-gamma-D-glutamyl-meso-diaminopimelate ligase
MPIATMLGMHLHIIGICGTFMGGLALLARARGFKVTGCDANVYPPMSTQLEQAGIGLVEGFSEDQLGLAPDVWVVGNVATRGMPLVEALLNRSDRLVSGPQWLAENILCDHRVLAVSGTHGKTTTSSMLAWILEDAGLSPSFLIGGVPENFGVSARLSPAVIASPSSGQPSLRGPKARGNPPPFVIEADEYDTAFFDKRSKFLHYRAEIAILNNLEFDHADIFADLAAIETQFHHWIRTLPAKGRLIVNAQEEALARVIARGAYTPVEYFNAGREIATAASQPRNDAPVTASRHSGVAAHLPNSDALMGAHNQTNAEAAIKAAVAYGVTFEQACDALKRFKGVKRRMQLRGEINGVQVLDDFAHHPTAIATTVEGLREQMNRVGNAGKILAVIEPRSNTMKLGVMSAKLADSLKQADQVFAYAGGISWDLKGALLTLGDRAHVSDDLEQLVSLIVAQANAGDRILVMSNGGFGGIHQKLLHALGETRHHEEALQGRRGDHRGPKGASQ